MECPTLRLLRDNLIHPSINNLPSNKKSKNNEQSNIPNMISKLSIDDYKSCQDIMYHHYNPINYVDNEESLLLFQLIAVRFKLSLSSQVEYHATHPWIRMSWNRAMALSLSFINNDGNSSNDNQEQEQQQQKDNKNEHDNNHFVIANLFDDLLKLLLQTKKETIKRQVFFKVSILESMTTLILKSFSMISIINSSLISLSLSSILVDMINLETDDLLLHRLVDLIVALYEKGMGAIIDLSLIHSSKVKYQIISGILKIDNQNRLISPQFLLNMTDELVQASYQYPTQISEIYTLAILKCNLLQNLLEQIIKFPFGRILFCRLVKFLSFCNLNDIVDEFNRHLCCCENNNNNNGNDDNDSTLASNPSPIINGNFDPILASNFFTLLKYYKTKVIFNARFLHICLESSNKELHLAAIDYICHNYRNEFKVILLKAIFNMMLDGNSHGRQYLIASLRHLFSLLPPVKKSDDSDILSLKDSLRQLSLDNLEFTTGQFNKLDLCLNILKLTGLTLINSPNQDHYQERNEKKKSIFSELQSLMLYNPFHEIQEASYEILRMNHRKLLANDDMNLILSLLNSPRECVSEGVAFASKLYNDRQVIWDILFKEFESRVNELITKGFNRDQICKYNPNPTLNCLYSILKEETIKNKENKEISSLLHLNKPILYNLADLTKRLMAFVSREKVFSSCPEAHCLEDDGDGDDLHSSSFPSSDKLSVTLCWRAIKMGALLLSCISTLVDNGSSNVLKESLESSHDSDNSNHPELSFAMDTSKFLIDQLLELRHPGAFCALEEPLFNVASLLSTLSRHALLKETIEKCLLQPRIETTRRSAGLPIAIKSLIIHNDELHLIMDPILKMLLLSSLESHSHSHSHCSFDNNDSNNNSNSDTVIIHSLNILRAIGRDFRFTFSPTFEGSILRIIFKYMKSHWSWPVRNGAMMLFSTWIQTILPISTNSINDNKDDNDDGSKDNNKDSKRKENRKEKGERKKWYSLDESTRSTIQDQLLLEIKNMKEMINLDLAITIKKKGNDSNHEHLDQVKNSLFILLIIFDRVKSLSDELKQSLWTFGLRVFSNHHDVWEKKIIKMTARVLDAHCHDIIVKEWQQEQEPVQEDKMIKSNKSPSSLLSKEQREMLIGLSELRDFPIFLKNHSLSWTDRSLPIQVRKNILKHLFNNDNHDYFTIPQSQFYLERNVDLMALMTEKCPFSLESLEIIKHDQYLLSIFLTNPVKRKMSLSHLNNDNDNEKHGSKLLLSRLLKLSIPRVEMSIDLLRASLGFKRYYYYYLNSSSCSFLLSDDNEADSLYSIIQYYQSNEIILADALPLIKNREMFIDICNDLLRDDQPESTRLAIAQVIVDSGDILVSIDRKINNDSKEWNLYYRLLTDDCEEIRSLIAPFIYNNFFAIIDNVNDKEGKEDGKVYMPSKNLSIPEILKLLLLLNDEHVILNKVNVDDNDDVDGMKRLEKEIKSLFINEPLNMFRDEKWELLYLKKYRELLSPSH